MKLLKGAASVLLLIGVVRGFIRYQENSSDGGVVRFVVSAVQAIEDITYKAIPAILGFLQQIAS